MARLSFVLRLDREALSAGEVVGDIEEVGSGSRAGIRDWDEVVVFCTSSIGPEADGACPDVDAPSTLR